MEKKILSMDEEQGVIHMEELIRVLDRAGSDREFAAQLLHHWADALEEYGLTGEEKLALLTGDVAWIERYAGPLTEDQKRWLHQPLSAEALRTFGW